jgi:hypothetical protein
MGMVAISFWDYRRRFHRHWGNPIASVIALAFSGNTDGHCVEALLDSVPHDMYDRVR